MTLFSSTTDGTIGPKFDCEFYLIRNFIDKDFLIFDLLLRILLGFGLDIGLVACVVHVVGFLIIRLLNRILKQNEMLKIQTPCFSMMIWYKFLNLVSYIR